MMKFFVILIIWGVSLSAHPQFTIIPTGTNANITDLVLHNDTVIISGTRKYSVPNSTNYFAKYSEHNNLLIELTPPGQLSYYNFGFQIVQNSYYILSIQGNPYEHNYILKSKDYGQTWQELYDTTGLFYSLTMLDTTFGIMGGTFGNYAITQGSDTSWKLDTLYSILMAGKGYGDSTILLLSFAGSSYLTNDRGQNWHWGYCENANHKKIQFISQDTVYAVSFKGTTPKAYFSYSFNGGLNFSTTDIGHNPSTSQYDYYAEIYDLYFKDSQKGYLIGNTSGGGTIFSTNDGGQTFIPYLTGINEKFYSLLNVNDSIAFIGGGNGLLLKWDKTISLVAVLEVKETDTNDFYIYPNPADEYFTVQKNGKSLTSEMIIKNVIGETIFQRKFAGNAETINVSKYPTGIYFVTIIENGHEKTLKIIIQH